VTPSGHPVDVLTSLAAQMAVLSRQNEEMLAELRLLRRENDDLRRQLADARGVGVNLPYSVSSRWTPPSGPPPAPALSPPVPAEEDVLMQPASPTHVRGPLSAALGSHEL
jgi:hypothetical protein